jgi:hypothetical protein
MPVPPGQGDERHLGRCGLAHGQGGDAEIATIKATPASAVFSTIS